MTRVGSTDGEPLGSVIVSILFETRPENYIVLEWVGGLAMWMDGRSLHLTK